MKWTEATARAAVLERASGGDPDPSHRPLCELGCGRPVESFGHRKRRSQGGAWDPVNAVALCGDGTRGCHGILTGNPDLAKAGGWEVSAYADPESVPVFLVTSEGAHWWWLTYDEHGHVRVWVDPEEFGLPERPVLPREWVAQRAEATAARRAEERAALDAAHDAQAAGVS